MIEAKHLHKVYRTGAVSLQVLKGVNLTINAGEFVAVTGPSGAGKSTLLHLLAGLDVPSEGEVLWEGTPLSRMSDTERSRFRNRSMGFVFQFYHLMPELSALENVMLPGLVDGRPGRRSVRARALDGLAQVELKHRAHHKPSQLSGGELQRVAIARALLNRPKVIFCDEPTGNLDAHTGQAVTDLLRNLNRTQGMSLILATHERGLAQLAGRLLVLRDGRVVEDSSAGGSSRPRTQPLASKGGSTKR